MTSTFIDDHAQEALRRLLGRRHPWIFGTPFLGEGGLTVATRFAFYVGDEPRRDGDPASDAYVWFGSERFETAKDYLDYGELQIGLADSLAAALGTSGKLYTDTSALVNLGQEELERVRIFAATLEGSDGELQYDAIVRFEFGRRHLSLGHAPGVYEGVCLTAGAPVTLGNPTQVWERLVLER